MLVRRLKLETQSLHAEVEGLVRELAGDFSADDYRDWLARLYGFFEPLERQLATRRDWPEGFKLLARLKTPLLAVDLHVLAVKTAHLPRCDVLPRVDTLSRALGALYVTEGATLGGPLIERRLVERLPHVSDARAYLSSYSGRTGAKWRAMGDALDQAPQPDETVAAACDTFRCLTTWLAPERGARVSA